MPDQLDDIDRLFARLERTPAPDQLTARVLAQTVQREARARRMIVVWPWIIAGIGALAVLTVAGYLLGASLASSDGLEIVEAVVTDMGLLTSAPDDVLAAINEVVPWDLVVVGAISAVCMVWAVGRAFIRPADQRRGLAQAV